jgi:hypothetical protein
MTRTRAGRRWCAALLVATLAGLAGCDARSEVIDRTGGDEPGVVGEVSDLGHPPLPLTADTFVRGLDGSRLVVVTGRQVATYDFAASRWTRYPDAPFRAAAVSSVESTILLLAPDCANPCDPEADAPTVAAGYDVTTPRGWRTRRLAVRPIEPRFFAVLDVGLVGAARVLAISDVFAIDAALEVQRIPQPAQLPLGLCADGTSLQALVPLAEPEDEAASPVGLATIGPGGNAGLAVLARPGGRWQRVPGSETSTVAATTEDTPTGTIAVDTITSRMCAGSGIVLSTRAQTLTWNGDRWDVHPGGPPSAVPPGLAAATSDGLIVAPVATGPGSVATWAGGTWTTTPVVPAPPADDPASRPLISVATVGRRVIVFRPPTPQGQAGTLLEVPR